MQVLITHGRLARSPGHAEQGRTVEFVHRNGQGTRHPHWQKVFVKPARRVKRGQLIAEVGSCGRSTGPQLHVELPVEGVQQDPARFLAAAAAPGPRAKDLARR